MFAFGVFFFWRFFVNGLSPAAVVLSSPSWLPGTAALISHAALSAIAVDQARERAREDQQPPFLEAVPSELDDDREENSTL